MTLNIFPIPECLIFLRNRQIFTAFSRYTHLYFVLGFFQRKSVADYVLRQVINPFVVVRFNPHLIMRTLKPERYFQIINFLDKSELQHFFQINRKQYLADSIQLCEGVVKPNLLTFPVPSPRFETMIENLDGCFLDTYTWEDSNRSLVISNTNNIVEVGITGNTPLATRGMGNTIYVFKKNHNLVWYSKDKVLSL